MKENYQLLLKSFRSFLRMISGQKHPPHGYSNHLKAAPAFLTAPYQQLNKSMLNVFAVLFFGLLFTVNATAQVSGYGFTPGTSGTLNAMTGSTQLVGSGQDDGVSGVTNIGFTFNYAGTNYTQFSANSNGLLRLGGTVVTSQWTNTAANGNTASPAIMAYWDDLATGAAAGGGKVHYISTGTAPNRSLIVEWFVTVPRVTTGNANARIQCKLDETTNVITFTYGAVAANGTGYSIGLITATAVYNSVTTSSNTNSNSAFMTANTGAIASGRTYTFTPPLPCTTPDAATNVAFTNTTANATTVSWSAAATNASNGYTVFRSTSATPPTVTNGTAYTAGTFYATNYLCVYDGSATTTTVSNLTPNTNYYYYVFARNNACTGTPFYAPVVSAANATAISDPIMTGVANLSDTNATIVWVAADTGSGYDTNAPKYTLEYADNAAFTGATAITGLTASTYDLALTPAATYYVRVTGVGTLTSNPTSVINFIAKKDEWTPFTLTATSFNHDVILDGKKGGTGMATTGIDGANWCYYENGYSTNEWTSLPTTGNGLPNNHLYTSSSKNYFIGSYKTNNALRLLGTASSPNNGVLELTNPTAVTSLDVIATSGDAASSFTVTLGFADGSSAPASGTLTINDWSSATSAIMTGVRRIKIDNTSEGGTFYIGYVNVAVPAAYQGKILKYVTINRTEGGNGKVSILGVTGKTTPDCITPSTLTTSNITDSSVTLNWAALAETPANGYEYYYSASNTAPAYAATVNAANVVTTNSAAVILPAMGTYYWWVRSLCGATSTSNWASGGSFITVCSTPSAATATAITNVASSALTVNWTAPATTPTGYFVVRSTTATLSATPVNGTTYTANASFGGGTVSYVGAATTFNATGLSGATTYYYFVYAYNSGTSCAGPVYSTTLSSASATTLIAAPLVVGASNIKNSSANLNWTPSTGIGPNPTVTYTLEVYTDSNYQTLYTGGSFTGLTTLRQSIGSVAAPLTPYATYYWRVRADQSGQTSSDWALGSFKAENTYTPLDVTSGGYNHDVIANGTGAAQYSTTAAVDAAGAGNAYVSRDYVSGAGVATPTIGLPVNRFLSSGVAATAGLNFIIPDYSGNNCLRLESQNQNGTLVFETPVKLTDIYIAATGGSGALTGSAEIFFENGTSQLTSNIAIPDWVSGATTTAIVNNLGRANRTNTTGAIEVIASKIFQVGIAINVANQAYKVTSVKFTKTTSGALQPVFDIFAISGKIIGDCPTMASASATAPSYTTATISAVLATAGEGLTAANVWYKVEVYTNSNFTGAIPGSPFTTATGVASQDLTGLTAVTTYYYKVTAINSACESTAVTGSFTTPPSCITPAGLSATSTLTSGTINWTAPTSLPADGYEYFYSTSSAATPNNTTALTATSGSGAVAAGITTATITGLNVDTTYYFWVRSNCSTTDKSAWSASSSFFVGYCVPTYTNCDTGHFTSVVTATGPNLTFSNTVATGDACNAAGRNRTATLITVSPGQTYTFTATTSGWMGVGIAADFDISGNFAGTELLAQPLYDGSANTTPAVDGTHIYSMSVAIPAGTALGQYRLRVWNRLANANNGFPNSVSACDPYTYGSYIDYTLNVVAPPTCFSPSTPVSSNIAATTATIGWSAASTAPANGYEYYISTSGTAPTAATAATAAVPAGLTANLTSLASSTTYYFWVRSVCGESDKSDWTASGTFTTTQIPATLNLADGFEGTNNWTFVNGSQTNKWFVGSATSNGGTKSLYISDDAAGATYNYNIGVLSVTQAYRDIAIPAGTGNVEFSFDWKGYGESTYDYLRVWLVPSTYTPVAGTQISAGTGLIQIGGNLNQQSVYNTYSTPTLNLSSFAGQTMRLVFEWRNDGSLGTQPPASIDNVSIVIPTCPGPTAITATGGFSTGTISWTAPSAAPAGGYDYYYSTTNTAPAAAVAGTNTAASPVNLTGLTPSVTYYVWVRSHCSDSDKGTWVSGGGFYTGYCTPTYAQACDTGHRISAISVTEAAFSTTMASGCTHDYTATQIAVTAGNTYTFNVTVTGWASMGIAADFNNNGNLADTGEVVALPNYQAADPYTYTVSVVIPTGTTAGAHRIRFWYRLANGGDGSSPCGSYNYGTWVDYTLNVTVPCFDWTGTVDNSWTNTANWCGGVLPSATADVTIASSSHNPFINSGIVYVNSLVVEEGAILTVNTGATLNVATTITSSEIAPNIIVNNNGAIVQGNSSTANDNIGNIVFHKYANPLYRLDYTLWSSPITGQTLRNFSLGTSNNRFYTYGYQVADGQTAYDEAYWPVNPITTYFAEGKGYLIRMPNTITADVTGADENGNATTTTPALYAAGTGNYIYDGAFAGKANNGPYNPALIQLPGTVTAGSETYGYYNAVGNPYPSPISVSDFLTANSGNLAGSTGIWLWRKKNGSETSYLTLNLSGLVTPPTDTNGNGTLDDTLSGFYESTPNTNWVIAPGQGFIVQAQPTATSVSFTNSMRRATPGATQAFFRSAANTASRYWLNMVAQNGSGSQALVAYSENGTTGIDFGYDSKVFGGETSLALYSVVTDNKLAIQARPEFEASDIVPMGFTAPTAGQYTISIDHNDGIFAAGQAIYLKDLQEGVIRNLSENNYTFTSEAGTFEGRFEVHYQTSALGTDNPVLDANSVVVFKQGNAISINTGSAMMNSVKVFDVRGRQLYSQGGINATETVISNLNVQQQVLIVEIATEKGTVTKRIVF
jgi:GEVED domain/Fibronectin type III domain